MDQKVDGDGSRRELLTPRVVSLTLSCVCIYSASFKSTCTVLQLVALTYYFKAFKAIFIELYLENAFLICFPIFPLLCVTVLLFFFKGKREFIWQLSNKYAVARYLFNYCWHLIWGKKACWIALSFLKNMNLVLARHLFSFETVSILHCLERILEEVSREAAENSCQCV